MTKTPFSLCEICGEEPAPPKTSADEPPTPCQSCRKRYPPSLIKAASDHFQYALKLRTGETIWFHHAEIHGDFATLYRDDENFASPVDTQGGPGGLPFPCPRGVMCASRILPGALTLRTGRSLEQSV